MTVKPPQRIESSVTQAVSAGARPHKICCSAHKNSVSAKAVTEVTLMANDETFRYDPTPMNHAFPGQPDDCFDMVNQYGTYNIQKTADTDNAYPAIAQGMPKVGHFARRSKAMFDLAGGEKKK